MFDLLSKSSAICIGAAVGLALSLSGASALQLNDPDHLQWIYLAGVPVPDRLYSGGEDLGKTVRVCRVRHRKDFEIGYIGNGFCQIGGDGMSRPYSEYEVLVFAKQTGWRETKRLQLPDNAVDFSAGIVPLSPMHVCRIHYQNDIAIGMLDGHGYCIAGYATGELKSDEFDILIRK